ncbi:hypothetical protein H4R24_001008 [Coemansia sp. RSA 988]|nr:hypothetical protein H4R24_001008 [Coemansia sp. RSA 988]
MKYKAENVAESNSTCSSPAEKSPTFQQATILIHLHPATMTSTGTRNTNWPAAGQSHQDVIATGLQRQLDELRELIRQGTRDCGSGNPQDKSALEDMRRLQNENEQQRVRIIHLLRALDNKDRLIDQLRISPEKREGTSTS